MAASPQTPEYYAGLNTNLLRAIPAQAQRILEVGCGEGRLGAALKAADPRRKVYGVEQHPHASQVASQHLDEVFTLDIQRSSPPIELGSLDCLVFGDVLEHLADPGEVLRRLRVLLQPNGWVVASIPNIGHHSVINALLQGDWQYQPHGLLDATHLRFFTFASALKLFLDAGFAAEIVDTIQVPASPRWQQALLPLANHLGTASERVQYSTNAYQFIIRGRLLAEVRRAPSSVKVSFSVCVSDEEVLQSNLLASADLQRTMPHEVRLWRHAPSAAAAHNQVLEQAQADWIICVHQDVYLPDGWVARFLERLTEAETTLGELAVVGLYGITNNHGKAERAGHVLDRIRLLREPAELPCIANSLDELLIAVRRESGLRFDPSLGWHLYGTDICLEAQRLGKQAGVVDALCFHNQRAVELPAAFDLSAGYLARKWPERMPLQTPCMVIPSPK